MIMDEIKSRLNNPYLSCYSCVAMAIVYLDVGDMPAAIARLRVDADKVRTEDKVLYEFICSVSGE